MLTIVHILAIALGAALYGLLAFWVGLNAGRDERRWDKRRDDLDVLYGVEPPRDLASPAKPPRKPQS